MDFGRSTNYSEKVLHMTLRHTLYFGEKGGSTWVGSIIQPVNLRRRPR